MLLLFLQPLHSFTFSSYPGDEAISLLHWRRGKLHHGNTWDDGKMSSFDPKKETWTSYMERLDFYFLANGVTTDDKKKAILLMVCGAPTYQLLRGLLQPKTPTETSLKDIKKKAPEPLQPQTFKYCPTICIPYKD